MKASELRIGNIVDHKRYRIPVSSFVMLDFEEGHDGAWLGMISDQGSLTELPLEIAHIHSLMNLFHSLTGNELELK